MAQEYRFGGFCLDPAARELHQEGAPVTLPAKTFECLTYLIEHRDRAVGRDELISAVWGRVDVSEALLAQTLWRLRRSLGEMGSGQAAIRTIPRFGYRWVAAVEATNLVPPREADFQPARQAAERELPASPAASTSFPADVEADFVDAPIAEMKSSPWRYARVLKAVVFVTVLSLASVLAVVAWHKRQISASADAGTVGAKVSKGGALLVLPVDVTDTDPETAWIRLGAMDYLARHLREGAGLQVSPSDQVMALLGQGENASPRSASELHRLELATGAAQILAPRATRSNDGWDFSIDLYHDGDVESFAGHDASPLRAASLAETHFLEHIGLLNTPAGTEPQALSELVQRLDAAWLAGDVAQSERLIENAPATLKGAPEFIVRAGRVALRAGDLDKAERSLQPLAQETSTSPSPVRAEANLWLGAVALERQNFDLAGHYYSKAIDLLGEHGDSGLLARAYMERGLADGAHDQIDAAMADFGRARIWLERSGDRLGSARLEVYVGMVEGHRDHKAEAIEAFDRAIAVFSRFGVPDSLAVALQVKTYAQLSLLDVEGALATSERAWKLAEHLRNPAAVQSCAVSRVSALLAGGQLAAASTLINRFDPASLVSPPSDPSEGDSPAFAVLKAKLLVAQGNPSLAARGAEKILDEVARGSDPTNLIAQSDTTLTFVDAALRSGQIELADRLLARLRAAGASSSQDSDSPFVLELAHAEVLASRSDAAAVEHYTNALRIADRRGQPELVVTANVAYARYLLDRRILAEAPSVLGRLVPFVDRSYLAARAAAALYSALGDTALAETAAAKSRTLAGERDPRQPL